jgi:hypothetical protein
MAPSCSREIVEALLPLVVVVVLLGLGLSPSPAVAGERLRGRQKQEQVLPGAGYKKEEEDPAETILHAAGGSGDAGPYKFYNMEDEQHIEDAMGLYDYWMDFGIDKLIYLNELAGRASQHKGGGPDGQLVLGLLGDSTMLMQSLDLCYLVTKAGGKPWAEDGQQHHGSTPACCLEHICFHHEYYCYARQRPDIMEKFIVSDDLIYFGCGLHLLHLIGAREWDNIATTGNLAVWLGYEDFLLNIVRRSEQTSTRLIFMTTHAMIDKLFTGEYATEIELYQRGDKETMSACVETARPAVEAALAGDIKLSEMLLRTTGGLADSESLARSYCLNGHFSDRASQFLTLRAKIALAGSSVSSVVHGYGLVSGEVWATQRGDSRHFARLVMIELAGLLSAATEELLQLDGVLLQDVRPALDKLAGESGAL